MRNNGSVTQKEIVLHDHDQLVSVTNEKGVVIDVNDIFVRISGFSRQELIGQAHNIVRHSDMPSAVFALMWHTIQQGRSWRGIVKNRCNNGDHYWVDAYVTPAYERGKIVSFESVRQKPRREWIERAEQVYQRINSGKPAIPFYYRMLEKKIHWIIAVALTLLMTTALMLFTGVIGLWFAPLALASQLIAAKYYGLGARVNHHLSLYSDDDICQYIYTGHLSPDHRFEFLEALHARHLHTVMERMDQQGEVLQQMSVENSKRARSQFEDVEEERKQMESVASAVQQMTHSVQEIAHSSEHSTNATDKANHITRQGMAELNEVERKMEHLVQTMDNVISVVNRLATDSEEIRSVMSVISAIAEQTNLLALNAAIEAARAGDQGRGFAVVADEVRALAGKTQNSTETIATIINNLLTATGDTVSSIHSGAETSRQAKDSMAQVKAHIAQLADVIRGINSDITTIADLAAQQALASDEIGRNSEAVLNLTENLAQSAEQTLQFSETLTNQAGKQAELINRFRRS